MIIRQFTERDFKRIYEIEAMSFENSYGNDIILKLYKIGSGFLVAEINEYITKKKSTKEFQEWFLNNYLKRNNFENK